MVYTYKDQQIVNFDNGIIKGMGMIVGVATTPFAVIGSIYVIQVGSSEPSLPTEEYPFSAIPMSECYISKLDKQNDRGI